ncbi:MAG: hypothetical protein PHS32_00120 [Rhodoferax sp.]|uniref:hypothetical protein n=1 Tax=Rhodoferax sp. TaxID=50421 RepID=UPI00262E7859|nr:hypothetical protein [Rhodoferax sp.]MDD5332121.1 hypothetical protein [Rhodoferax sp.]
MMKLIQSLISTLFPPASLGTGPVSGFAGCLHTVPELSAKRPSLGTIHTRRPIDRFAAHQVHIALLT